MRFSRYADLVPLGVFAVLIGLVAIIDRERPALWVTGTGLALSFAFAVLVLHRRTQLQAIEIARRQQAEDAAQSAAAEARIRAQEARDLAAQLEAAHAASQRLSTSLDPVDVVELFLGTVAEIVGADVASLYTIEVDDDDEDIVGRYRIIFRDIVGVTDRLRLEDIRDVRIPVAAVDSIAHMETTGAAIVLHGTSDDGWPLEARSARDGAVSSVSVPLLVAGHMVGAATWIVYSHARSFPPATIAFAQALAAPAAAALRTAELFLSLETERRSAAREAGRFGAVIDQMADGVIVVDEDGRIERSNAAAEQLLNATMSDMPLAEWPERFRIVSGRGRRLAPSEFPLVRALRGRAVRRSSLIVRPERGAERHLSCSATPIRTADGDVTGAAMVLRDATDEHQYAEMLRHTNRELRRQAEALEQVNHRLREATRAKDQFLAVMSHELRTPINAIMGYSDLLDLGVKGPLNNEQRGMLARVHETSRHLLGLINEVLDLAKISAGRMDVVIVDLDVGAIIERAARQILPQAAARGLTLEVEPPRDDQRVIVCADETRLTQIVINLLSNAVKFTQRGSVRLRYDGSGDYVTIDVTDTGPGISADQLERIFDEFYQVEGGLSRASGGSGLGLTIARRFARLMGGDIRVASEPGRGSTFSVSLPVPTRARLQPTASVDAAVIVLAHDDITVARLADELRGALTITGTTEPTEFAALARRGSPQLLAVDACAPENAAWRALGSLQAEVGARSVPLLLYARQDDEGSTAIELGHVTALAKPLPVEQVLDAVIAGTGSASSRVLVADSDPDVRRIAREALTAAGCEVHTAASGEAVVDTARAYRPDIAIIDLAISGMTGLEAIATMRSEPALDAIPVIILVSPEMTHAQADRLNDAVASFSRTHRSRVRPTAAILRTAAESMVPAS